MKEVRKKQVNTHITRKIASGEGFVYIGQTIVKIVDFKGFVHLYQSRYNFGASLWQIFRKLTW